MHYRIYSQYHLMHEKKLWGFLGHSGPLRGAHARQAPLGSGTVDKEQKLLKAFKLDFNSAGVSNFSGGAPGFFWPNGWSLWLGNGVPLPTYISDRVAIHKGRSAFHVKASRLAHARI